MINRPEYIRLAVGACMAGSVLLCNVRLAQADASATPPSCSSKTGGSSNSLASSTNGKYECAYTAGNNNNKIGGWKTESWTSSTAPGYYKQYNCNGQSGSVSISTMYQPTSVGSSITFTASNSSTGDRHWWSGVLWQTQANGGVADDQYIHDCNGNTGDVRTNKMYITTTGITSYPQSVTIGSTGSFNISVSAPYGNSPAQGKVYLYEQKNSGSTSYADPTQDYIIGYGTLSNGVATVVTNFSGQTPDKSSTITPVVGPVLIYAVMATNPNVSADPAPTPPNTGWVGSQSASYTVNLVATAQSASMSESLDKQRTASIQSVQPSVDKPQVTRSVDTSTASSFERIVRDIEGDGYAPLTALCPKGTKPIHAEAEGDTQDILEGDLGLVKQAGLFGISVKLPPDRNNTKVKLQVVCRQARAEISQVEGLTYGTPRDDKLSTDREGEVVFSGLGDDDIELNHSETIAFAGLGNDRVRLFANNSVVSGGHGKDRIEVVGSGQALIIGGPGRDKLIGGAGMTRINAVDGKPGDEIVCNSPENLVMADEGDKLSGPCTVVNPDSPL